MAKKSFRIKDSLAQALDDTVSSAKNNAGELHIEIIPLRKVELDPDNPRDLSLSLDDLYHGLLKSDHLYSRKMAEKEALRSIQNSIQEQGIINPIVVYKHGEKYRLIAGERRTLGSVLANKKDIPAKILTVKPNPLKLSLLQWIENIEREDLTLWERMRNLEKILIAHAESRGKLPSGVSPTELGHLIGCSLQQAVNYCHVLSASPKVKEAIQQGQIKNIEKAAVIAKAPGKVEQLLIQSCARGATLKELKQLARDTGSINPAPAPSQYTAIHLGSTRHSKVAKLIMQSILANKSCQSHLQLKSDQIHWDDFKAVSLAFKTLVQDLEKADI